METLAPPNLDRYIGTTVRLWPYLRGAYPKDTLYRLWASVERAGAFRQLFWGLQDVEAKHGDLEHFVRYFGEGTGRHLFIVQALAKDEIAGFFWLDDVVPGLRGIGSVYMVPAYRGETSLEALKLFCDYVFTESDLTAIWGVTPWESAQHLIEAGGFELVAMLPAFAKVKDHVRNVLIYRLTKESFYGVHLS